MCSRSLVVYTIFVLLFLVARQSVSCPTDILFALLYFYILCVRSRGVGRYFVSIVLVSRVGVALFVLFLLFVGGVAYFLVYVRVLSWVGGDRSFRLA